MADEINAISLKSASGREMPEGTLVELYFMSIPGTIGVKIKFPGARKYEDLGGVPIKDKVVHIPFRTAFIAYAREDKNAYKETIRLF